MDCWNRRVCHDHFDEFLILNFSSPHNLLLIVFHLSSEGINRK